MKEPFSLTQKIDKHSLKAISETSLCSRLYRNTAFHFQMWCHPLNTISIMVAQPSFNASPRRCAICSSKSVIVQTVPFHHLCACSQRLPVHQTISTPHRNQDGEEFWVSKTTTIHFHPFQSCIQRKFPHSRVVCNINLEPE